MHMRTLLASPAASDSGMLRPIPWLLLPFEFSFLHMDIDFTGLESKAERSHLKGLRSSVVNQIVVLSPGLPQCMADPEQQLKCG